jgi:hypothetical protein
MNYDIYRGDGQNVPLPDDTYMGDPTQKILRWAEYVFKAIGKKKWYAVLNNGQIVPVASVDRKRIVRVGSLCKFHREFSHSIYRHFKYENHPLIQAEQRDERMEIMKSRKVNIWTKERIKLS